MSYSDLHPVRLQAGAAKLLPFRFYAVGSRTPLPVNTATSIVLEYEKNGVAYPPVPASRTHPDANWTDGLVPILIDGTNVTHEPGSYSCRVVATIGSEKLILPEAGPFLIEVGHRTVYVGP